MTKPEDIVGCCNHPAGRHGEDGCEVGWNYDSYGVAQGDGCDCEMRGPK